MRRRPTLTHAWSTLTVLLAASAFAQDAAKSFPPEQVKRGATVYAKNCATCHGNRMSGGEWAIDLNTFPKDNPARFVDSVTYGKNTMPSWGDVLSKDEIAALWAYVFTGDTP
jgi:mono/diheme cytochrome c family protein